MKSLSLILLITGMAWGQTAGPVHSELKVFKSGDRADGEPILECAELADDHSIKKDSFCCLRPLGTDKVTVCYRWDGQGWQGVEGPSGDADEFSGVIEDVPAIQEKLGKHGAPACMFPFMDEGYSLRACEGFDVPPVGLPSTQRWTCADKGRILQHDEDTPPKFWCHAPNTGGK